MSASFIVLLKWEGIKCDKNENISENYFFQCHFPEEYPLFLLTNRLINSGNKKSTATKVSLTGFR